jgi:hypothetical protein
MGFPPAALRNDDCCPWSGCDECDAIRVVAKEGRSAAGIVDDVIVTVEYGDGPEQNALQSEPATLLEDRRRSPSSSTCPGGQCASVPGPALVSNGTILPSSVVTGDRLARAQTHGSTLGPRLRLGDLRQVYVDLLVGDAVEQMPDEVQPGAALVH